MKKSFFSLLLLLWFYGFRVPVAELGEGVFSSVIMGPFQSELECQKARAAHQKYLDEVIPEAKVLVTNCQMVKGVEL